MTEKSATTEGTGQRSEKTDPLGKRVLIGGLIRHGIQPPVFLVQDTLIERALHWLYGDSESGKTWLVLWLVKMLIEAAQRVLYLDQENGPEVIGERLELLGCDPDTIDRYFCYYEEPDLRLDPESVKRILARIEEINPALTIFDSTRGFLTAAGLEESSNDDLDKLYSLLLKPMRSAHRTSVVLDHRGHAGNRARGASRKKDMCDVIFEVSSTGFDESKLGEIRLTRRKGRRGHVPERITFSAGGGEKGFVFERSAGTITDLGLLTAKDRQALEFIAAGGANGSNHCISVCAVTSLGGSSFISEGSSFTCSTRTSCTSSTASSLSGTVKDWPLALSALGRRANLDFSTGRSTGFSAASITA